MYIFIPQNLKELISEQAGTLISDRTSPTPPKQYTSLNPTQKKKKKKRKIYIYIYMSREL